MTQERLLKAVNGELVSDSKEREFFRVTRYPKKVEEGDVCFVNDLDEAKQAYQNGASALIYSLDFIHKDDFSDILLIKVEDLERSSFLLLSSIFGEDDASFELISPKVMTFLKMILTQKSSVEFIPNDYKKAFELILNSNKRLFVGCDEFILKNIRDKKLFFDKKAPGHIVSSDSLFRTTFKVHKYIYQYKKLAPFHLDALRCAVSLCDEYELPYSLDKINYTRHFKPIFLEGEPSIQEVMKNDKVVILSDNLEDILKARTYAINIGNWMAKTVVMVPPKTKVDGVKIPLYYRNNEDILEAIDTASFNYLFIYTDDLTLESSIYKMRT